MMIPTIHPAGSGPAWLENTFADAKNALSTALNHLAKTTPQACDYIVQNSHMPDPEAYVRALNEHNGRIGRLLTVHDELCTIIGAIRMQIKERRQP
jgi:hypothetical protein